MLNADYRAFGTLPSSGALLLGHIPMPADRGLWGEETAQKIDAEIKRILTDAHDKARQILTDHRAKLESVTYRLLEVEVMEGDELRELLGAPPPPDSAGETVPLPPMTP